MRQWSTFLIVAVSRQLTRHYCSPLQAFGAFVEIAPGKQGLVHISEIDVQAVSDASAVLKVGQSVDVMVLDVEDGR